MDLFIAVDWLTVSLIVVSLLLISAGMIGMILPAIPGPPILLIGLFTAAWAEDFRYVGSGTLIVLAMLCVAAVALDFIAGALGAKRVGASRAAAFGALLGAILGLFLLPIGLILGPFLGAMLGELSTGRPWQQAHRAGWGATIGMLLGIVAKLVIGMMMIALFVSMRLLS
ncbi:MAG: DUF456 domain-containing protein [Paraperlucidibaca sp.]